MIEVECAIAFPDRTWISRHFVEIDEDDPRSLRKDFLTLAEEKLKAELIKEGAKFTFVHGLHWDWKPSRP